MSVKNFKVSVAGRYPPPVGGVSVYVSRRFSLLKAQGREVEKLDFSDRFFPFDLFKSEADTYEVNSLNLLVVFIFFIFGKLSRCIFIDHNASRHYVGFKKKVLLFFIRRALKVYVVKPELKTFYPDGITVDVVSPFIVPDVDQLDSVLSSYSQEVLDFIEKGVFVVNSAWKFIPYNKTDVYGILDSVELLRRVDDIKLLLAVADYNPADMPAGLVSDIERFVNEGRLCLFTGQKQLWPVFKKSAVCLRLTPYDGDSVCVREAIHFGCKVLASDAAPRPSDCFIYPYGNFEQLKTKLKEMLE
ncbi:hypothetical protein [Rheinheimera oceanensis]|uniref:hypothetical protein n=1 Tax=Rheinheimera oceanensis TaxID=2817449 RepID=UPI001BFD0CE0|nr:hypothetical protein [Rheinheimera oceanensis]